MFAAFSPRSHPSDKETIEHRPPRDQQHIERKLAAGKVSLFPPHQERKEIHGNAENKDTYERHHYFSPYTVSMYSSPILAISTSSS
ncbi:MAG TPA: hypothetical protein VLT56_08120, partial [Desulfobacterales bacterium]|nr:hypothetical protein [Desulfobacterales bacterium]